MLHFQAPFRKYILNITSNFQLKLCRFCKIIRPFYVILTEENVCIGQKHSIWPFLKFLQCRKNKRMAFGFPLSYSSRSLEEFSRIDLYIKTDETVSKWNDFFLYLQSHLDKLKTSADLDTICTDIKENAHLSSAYTLWKNGHIHRSFDLFLKLYGDADFDFQQKILTTVQFLIFYTFTTKGKALVNVVIQGSIKFSDASKENCIMVTVWFSLFKSQWYNDRCEADKILQRDGNLKNSLEKIFPLLGYYFLKSRELSEYHRLIEISLQFDIERAAVILLRALFDYYYKVKYIKGCDVVFKCCKDIDIKLTENQNQKYWSLKKPYTKEKKKPADIFIADDIKYKF